MIGKSLYPYEDSQNPEGSRIAPFMKAGTDPFAWSLAPVETNSLPVQYADEWRNHIQPSEFVLSVSGRVLMFTYGNSPVGRMNPAEALPLIKCLNTQRGKK